MATRVKSTKKYQALLAQLDGDEKLALATYKTLYPEVAEPEVDPGVQNLVNSGFTEEQARQALAIAAQKKAGEKPAEEPDRKKVTEAMVAEAGLTFTKGRVYMTGEICEAVVRCLKTGKPTIVKSSGNGRTKAVLISKEESGDVSVQNLTKPV